MLYEEIIHPQKGNIVLSDSLMILNPPSLCLKYPIVSGQSWIYKQTQEIGNLYKKYIDFENMYVPAGRFSCIRTERQWPGNTGTARLFLYDYHSKYGEVSRDYFIKNILVTNEFGNPIGYTDLKDFFEVTSFNIP